MGYVPRVGSRVMIRSFFLRYHKEQIISSCNLGRLVWHLRRDGRSGPTFPSEPSSRSVLASGMACNKLTRPMRCFHTTIVAGKVVFLLVMDSLRILTTSIFLVENKDQESHGGIISCTLQYFPQGRECKAAFIRSVTDKILVNTIRKP